MKIRWEKMTKTELSILRLKQGPAVGLKTKSGLVRPGGHLNTWPKDVQAKIKRKEKTMTLEEQLVKHEDLKLKVYTCPSGKLTIGVGRNLEDAGISREEALLLLRNDIIRCRTGLAKALPYWHVLSPLRQRVLIDMAINLGLAKLLKFTKMIEALRQSDYGLVAAEMLDSVWAAQVKKRARWLALAMRLDREPTAADLNYNPYRLNLGC